MNKALAKRLTKSLSELPSDELKEMAQTEDLIKQWYRLRDFNNLIAVHWFSKFTLQPDPVRQLFQDGKIDRCLYRLVLAMTNCHIRLWELTESVAEYIQEVCAFNGLDYPFESPADLFLEILKTQADNQFCLSLNPYMEVSPGKLEKASKALAKGFTKNLSPHEFSNLKGWMAHFRFVSTNHWLGFVLCISQVLAKNNVDAVGDLLQALKEAHYRLAKINGTALSKRGSPTWNRQTAFAWMDGDRIGVSGQGNIYVSLP
jgi:hypothetical protein